MGRTVAIAVVVSLVLTSAFVGPVAGSNATADAGESIEEPAIRVDLESNGDATVSLVSVYDLSDEDERDAFESLESDDATQTELRDRFADRLDSVASDVEDDVDREMTVTADSVDVRTTDDQGIVTLSATWTGLAATTTDTVVLTEPFASGFEGDRVLIVTAPDDGTIESASPEPTTHDDARATWESDADLDGFEVTVSIETADSDASSVTSDGLPGFGPVIAGIAVALSLTVLGRR